MKEQFKRWLIQNGYKEYTGSGNRSTVYDYIKRIDFVCDNERIDWMELGEKIDFITAMYDIGGVKSYLGEISHRAVINALKRYGEFIEYRRETIDF